MVSDLLPETEWPHPEETGFLEGPQHRGVELLRAVRIFSEFMRGFRRLHFVGPCVTVFGSARFKEDHPYYALAREVGFHLAKEGFTVMTGGGPGIMEAANRGAKDASGVSVGCNIELLHEQEPNPYLDAVVTFRYFFVRKVMLVKYSYAFVVMPGGFGTLDEVFETATLIQTAKISDFPIVLVGTQFWHPMIRFMSETLVAAGTIDAFDLKHFLITDSPVEAAEYVRSVAMRKFGLKYQRPVGRRWWFFEFGRRVASDGTARRDA